MSWVPLDLRRGPTFAQECDEVIRTYGQAFLDGAQDVLDYLKTAIESRIATLEEFCRNNDTDPRHVVFDKQLRKLRRVLHNDPAMFAAQAGGAGVKQGGLRQPGEDVPPPPPPPEDDDETDSDDGVENVVGDDEADGLFRRASKMNLEEIPDAAKAKARGSVTMGASSMMASPRRKQSTIYSWERSGSMQAAAAKEEEILNIGGGASDESPFPPGFTFKVVLSNKEFHHLMARRRVQLAEKRHKHISKRVQQSNKDGKDKLGMAELQQGLLGVSSTLGNESLRFFAEAWNGVLDDMRQSDMVNNHELQVLVFNKWEGDSFSRCTYLPVFITAGKLNEAIHQATVIASEGESTSLNKQLGLEAKLHAALGKDFAMREVIHSLALHCSLYIVQQGCCCAAIRACIGAQPLPM